MVLAAYMIGAFMTLGGAAACFLLWPEAPRYPYELPFAARVPALTALLSGFILCFVFCVLAKMLDSLILIRRALKIADDDTAGGRYEPLPGPSRPYDWQAAGDDYWRPTKEQPVRPPRAAPNM